MKHKISQLEIKNFKSLKDLKFDCKRINVFIGEPNVGKSNILEALSLFVAQTCNHDLPILKEYVRYEKLSNLFYDQDRKNVIKVKTNFGQLFIKFQMNSINSYEIMIGIPDELFDFLNNNSLTPNESENAIKNYFRENNDLSNKSLFPPFYYLMRDGSSFNLSGRFDVELGYINPIKRYIFSPLQKHQDHFPLFLRPPYGDNLFTILESNHKLYEEAAHFFLNYGLDLLLDTVQEKLDVQKRIGNRVYKIPYSLAADTLQRIIFHIAAIDTNKDSVLLFEEPEAHSFPAYISLLADKMIENKSNQYFIATHSPYLLRPFIEQCSFDEVSIFICRYEDYETKVRALTKEEIDNIMETGIDMFYNIPAFKNDRS